MLVIILIDSCYWFRLEKSKTIAIKSHETILFMNSKLRTIIESCVSKCQLPL